ncbi:MAG TPA: DMT family transporter [Caldithrix abyssi]|uniref:DMT family transporter n=1 Tax=Caldithrix abyssi TaxID=187145 RepID=A0A7V1LP52_CALAY|nr:DMT family transporter [Caldithrix abyssi]
MPVSSKRLATFLLLASALIWGSSFILIKKGLLVFNATQVGLLRITFAMLALLPLALYSFKQYYRGRLLKLTVAGISGNLLPALLFATAQTHLDSGVTGVLNALTPLFTMLVGVILFNYRFIPRQLLGLIIGLTGATLISFIGKSGSWESFNYYSLLVLAASFLYGFNVNWIKRFLSDMPSKNLTALSLFLMGVPAMIMLFFGDFVTRMETVPGAWTALGYLAILGVVNTALALVLFFRLLQIANPVTTSSVTYIIPVIALVIGFLDGEALGWLHILGMGLILGGVIIINRSE